MGAAEFDYLEHCKAAEKKARGRARGVQALVYALLVGVIVGLVGWINQAPLKAEANWLFTERPYMLASVRPYVLTAEAERALKPLASFRECAEDCPEMVVVPAGEFLMGSPATEPDRQADEGPQHKVTIAKPFAVSKFDVTFADWDACVAVGECPTRPTAAGDAARGRRSTSASRGEEIRRLALGDDRQAIPPADRGGVEYAARAGSTTAYFWGDAVGAANANCIGCGSPWDGRETSRRGRSSRTPSASTTWPATSGNSSRTARTTRTTARPATVGLGRGDCSRHSVRGGSSNSPARHPLGRRYKISTATRDTGLGFRIARTLLGP